MIRKNRRTFLKTFITGGITIMIPAWIPAFGKGNTFPPLKTTSPQHILIIWYSQTGHTKRIGKLIQYTWQKRDLQVDATDYRNAKNLSLDKYDLILIGTPVHYMDIPVNLKKWINTLPKITGTAVSAYVTFGGKGDGQHNTCVSLLEKLSEKGGVPVGMKMFSNMSTFAPTWSTGNKRRILKYRHLPDETTFTAARTFAKTILTNISGKRISLPDKETDLAGLLNKLPQIACTKLLISDHHIVEESCITCGTCASLCPVGAIDLKAKEINTDKCIACIGCINNCPEQAISMRFMGKPVYGFNTFLKQEKIRIKEPVEFAEG